MTFRVTLSADVENLKWLNNSRFEAALGITQVDSDVVPADQVWVVQYSSAHSAGDGGVSRVGSFQIFHTPTNGLIGLSFITGVFTEQTPAPLNVPVILAPGDRLRFALNNLDAAAILFLNMRWYVVGLSGIMQQQRDRLQDPTAIVQPRDLNVAGNDPGMKYRHW